MQASHKSGNLPISLYNSALIHDFSFQLFGSHSAGSDLFFKQQVETVNWFQILFCDL